jgi:hypothetical protein
MCLACLVQPFSRLLALMWFARWVLIKILGSTPATEEARDFPIYCQRLSFFPEVPEHEAVAELFLPLK